MRSRTTALPVSAILIALANLVSSYADRHITVDQRRHQIRVRRTYADADSHQDFRLGSAKIALPYRLSENEGYESHNFHTLAAQPGLRVVFFVLGTLTSGIEPTGELVDDLFISLPLTRPRNRRPSDAVRVRRGSVRARRQLKFHRAAPSGTQPQESCSRWPTPQTVGRRKCRPEPAAFPNERVGGLDADSRQCKQFRTSESS